MAESGALSARHQKVDRLRRLSRQSNLRERERAFVLDGVKIIGEALDAGLALEALFVDKDSVEVADVSQLLQRAQDAGVRIHALAPGVLERVAGTVTPQPVLAIAPWCDVELAELVDPALVVVCVELRDPGNAGTILRSAEAAGAEAVIFCDGSVDVFNPKTVRASAGSMFHVPIVAGGAPDEVLSELANLGVRRLGTVAHGGTPYDEVDLSSPVALVMGNEANGIPEDLLQYIDEFVTIPMAGRAESLNVSMSLSVLCFEVLRRRRKANTRVEDAGFQERRRGPRVDPVGMEIVSTVSHELRSPLTAVKGYSSLLLNRGDRIGEEQRTMMLSQINHEADRVTRLIGELLDISRLETGRLVLQRRMVDIGALAASVVQKLNMEYPDLECSLEFDPNYPEVYADADKIEQVLTNLIENAAKYANPVGVRVVGAVLDNAVSVEVHDRGEGISASDLPKVFSKFFRRDLGRPTGSGLGLWISRGLVEAHLGTLVAESTEGQGSVFRFTLPTETFEKLLEQDKS